MTAAPDNLPQDERRNPMRVLLASFIVLSSKISIWDRKRSTSRNRPIVLLRVIVDGVVNVQDSDDIVAVNCYKP